MTEAARFYKTSVHNYQTIWGYIIENGRFQWFIYLFIVYLKIILAVHSV